MATPRFASLRIPSLGTVFLLASGVLGAAPIERSEADGLMERESLTGDWSGGRSWLADHGIEISAEYTAEAWRNTLGGLKAGSVYTGLLDVGVEVDLEQAVGWEGASLGTNWLWLSGSDASEELAGNFLTVSNIAGLSTLRMFELWLQQEFWDGKASIRVGQFSADSEFLCSGYSWIFVNGTFGWPAATYMNLPEGGPGYPMATLGARFEIEPVDWFAFRSAVFQGNVFAQDVNEHGFQWRLDEETGCKVLNEAEFRWNIGGQGRGLPGLIKPGFWIQTGDKADALGESTDCTNRGFHVVIDQMLFCESSVASRIAADGKSVAGERNPMAGVSTEECDQGLGWFLRASHAPDEHNFISTYFDTGFSYKGLIPSRDDDTIGIGFGYARLSNGARDSLEAGGSDPSDAEMAVELTYQAQLTPWLVLQPDLQYILNPGSSKDLDNALVAGLRVAIAF